MPPTELSNTKEDFFFTRGLSGRSQPQRRQRPPSARYCAAGPVTGSSGGLLSACPPAVTIVAPWRSVTKASAASPAFFTSCGSSLAGSSIGSSVRLQARQGLGQAPAGSKLDSLGMRRGLG